MPELYYIIFSCHKNHHPASLNFPQNIQTYPNASLKNHSQTVFQTRSENFFRTGITVPHAPPVHEAT